MSKKIKYVFLLLGVFLSVLFFASGVYTVSYADERINNNIVYYNDEYSTYAIGKQNNFNTLNFEKHSKSTSDFFDYYNNFTYDKLNGTQCHFLLNDITNFNELKTYFESVLNTTLTTGTYNINFDNFYVATSTRYGLNAVISNYLMTGITLNYGNATTQVVINGNTTTISNAYVVFINGIRESDNATINNRMIVIGSNQTTVYQNIYNSYLQNNGLWDTYIYGDFSNYSNNSTFTINNQSSNALLNIPLTDVTLDNNTLSFDYQTIYQKTNNQNYLTIKYIGVNSYVSDILTNNYPITIDTSQLQLIPIQDIVINERTFEINENLLTVNYGLGYVLHFYVVTTYLYSSNNVSLNFVYQNSLPFIYDYGAVPIVPLPPPFLSLSDNILTWTPVSNADFYVLKRTVDGVDYFTTLSNSISSYVLSVNGYYSVQACSNTLGYSDSVYSNVIIVNSFADTEYSFLLLFSAITDSILMLFKSFLNYSIFGINLFGAFGVLLFILLCLAILKFLRFNG